MGKKRSELEKREKEVLFAVITEYVATGRPVGSRRLASRYSLGCSSATIRAVMSRLESLRLLIQPHTSAGRIPSDAGYRVFVNDLIEIRDMSTGSSEIHNLKSRLEKQKGSELWRLVGRTLSELTQQAALLVLPSIRSTVLKQLKFIRTSRKELLAVFVSSTGLVQTAYIHPDFELSERELERIHNYLGGIVEGRTLDEVRRVIEKERTSATKDMDSFRQRALDLGKSVFENADAEDVHLVIEGELELLKQPEFSEAEELRRLLTTFKDQERLLKLLELTVRIQTGVQITIGTEDALGVRGLSLVSAPFMRSKEHSGALGVLGPTRMDYGSVIPLVVMTADALSDSLEDD